MTVLQAMVTVLAALAVGGVGGYLLARSSGDVPEIVEPANPIPDKLRPLSEAQARRIQAYQAEWQVVIETQMHFNDLIIRFRGLTLTAFAALTATALTIGEIVSLDKGTLMVVLVLPVAFWIAAAILDLAYYHRLLVGAVGEAAKFDRSNVFKHLGHFGLTATIRRSVSPAAARYLIVLYYLVPLVVVTLLVVWQISAQSAPTS